MASSAPHQRRGEPRVSVVAPTYRRREALRDFVEPLLAEERLFELVIAVDGSGDGSVEWLQDRAERDGRVKPLDLPNRGAGPARQAGIEAAAGEVVILLDDDVIARPGLVAGHARHHLDMEPKLVLGYMPNDPARVPRERRSTAVIYRRAYELHCQGFRNDPDFVFQGFWGGNVSMPREDFLRVGIEGLAIARGQDDREFGVRCAKAGIKPVFDPSLEAVHLYDRSIEAFRKDFRLQGESRRMLHDAHADFLGDDLADDSDGTRVADQVGMGLPAPVRPLWRLLGRDPLFGPVTAGLDALFGVSVRLEHLGLEVAAARALGSLETMRGVLERS